MKRTIIIGITLILFSCAGLRGALPGSSTTAVTSHIITLPESGNLIILGVSARQSRPENEINMARESAARKAAMFHSVSATSEEVHNIGTGYFDYYLDSYTYVEYDQELEKYMERLSFDPKKDVIRANDGTVFVRFSYPAAFPGNINYRSTKNLDGKPEWIARPPDNINGFIVGVGRSGRQDRFADTIRRSYEAAVISIVSKVSTSMGTKDSSITYQSETQIYRQSSGTLKNFLVLETWIDPETMAIYTLAIAEAAN